jgi:hypothetical protein
MEPLIEEKPDKGDHVEEENKDWRITEEDLSVSRIPAS